VSRRTLALLVWGLLLSSPAAARTWATAFVAGPWPETRASAALAQQLAREAIATHRRLTLRQVEEVLDPEGDAKTINAKRQAELEYRKGFIAFTNESYKPALKHFETSVKLLLEATAQPRPAAVVRAMQYAGATAILLRRYRDGITWFHRASVIAPKLGLVARDMDPGMVELYERVRRRATSQAPTDLHVISEPPDAAVFLDRRFVGVTPTVVPVPLAGIHLLRVAKDGLLPFGAAVEILPRVNEEVRLDLKPTRRLHRFNKLLLGSFVLLDGEKTKAKKPLRKLARLCAVDSMTLGRLEPRGEGRVVLRVMEYDVTNKQVIRQASRVFRQKTEAFAGKVSAFFQEFYAGSAGEDPTVADLPPAPPVPELEGVVGAKQAETGPFYATWWFWTGVGVAAAGGVTAAAVTRPWEEPPRPEKGDLLFQF